VPVSSYSVDSTRSSVDSAIKTNSYSNVDYIDTATASYYTNLVVRGIFAACIVSPTAY